MPSSVLVPKLFVKPQGPEDSRIQGGGVGADLAMGDLSCWSHVQLKGCHEEKPALPLTNSALTKRQPLGASKELQQEQEKSFHVGKRIASHMILLGPSEAVIVGFKKEWSWPSSDLNCLPKPKQCKYPYCKLALGSLRHWQCSISVIFVMRRRGIMWIYLIWWMLVL